jgi:Ni,Fe-hydrogenase III large subunit
MVHDLWGHRAEGARDLRPWLNHGRWAVSAPMASRPVPAGGTPEPPEFLTAEGADLYQIALGPIHGGITGPGHFRLTAHGETVVRSEMRLGYAHKGQLILMRGKSPRVAARFAARLSGDSNVANAVAFARAAEAALGVEALPRATALRGVMAEVERIAMHLADIAGVCAEAGAEIARIGRHREMLLRASALAFGHRLMMDCVVPGGVAADIVPGGPEAIRRVLGELKAELPAIARAYERHPGLAERVVGTGTVDPALAVRLAAGGYVGRAAGRQVDARTLPGYPPYDALDFVVPVLSAGDIDARIRIRLAEIAESIGMVGMLLDLLPEDGLSSPLPPGSGEGIGVAEGFRGDIWCWLRLEGGMIGAAFMRDPSWAQWPLLEQACDEIGDFQLCARSFNCSHSGVDL